MKGETFNFFGSIKEQLLGYLATAGAFIVFAPALVNNIYRFTGCSFEVAYLLFVVLYFFLISVPVIWLVYQTNHQVLFAPTTLPGKIRLGENEGFKPAMLLSLLCIALLGLYIWYEPLFLIIATLVVLLLLLACIRHLAPVQKQNAEMLILVIAIGVLTAVILIRDLRQHFTPRYNGTQRITYSREVMTDMALYEAANSAIRPELRRLNEKLRTFQRNVQNRFQLLEPDIVANSTKARTPSYKPVLTGADSALLNQTVTRSWVNTLVQNIRQKQKMLNDAWPQKAYTANVKDHLDLMILDLDLFGQSVESNVAEFESRVKKSWLVELKGLQWKGVLYFCLLLLVCVVLLDAHYKSIIGDVKTGPGSVRDEITKAPLHHDRSGVTFNSIIPVSASPHRPEASNEEERSADIRSVIFLILLLFMPFCRVFTEENIDLKKPFLNFYGDLPSLLNFEPREKESRVYPPTGNPSPAVTKENISVVVVNTAEWEQMRSYLLQLQKDNIQQGEQIKALGIQVIEDPKARKKFLEKFHN